jgi:hypothetical protein
MTTPTTIIQTRAESSPARDSRGGDTALPGTSPPRQVIETTAAKRLRQAANKRAAIEMAGAGFSAEEIAHSLGYKSKNSVRGMFSKLRAHGVVVPRLRYSDRNGTMREASPEYNPRVDADREAANSEACDRLLARLLKYHGRRPPDEDSRQAVARLSRTWRASR